MQGRDTRGSSSFEDELARRRAARRSGEGAPDGEYDDDEPVHLGWRDTFALIIAAYQVLFPMLAAMGGALLIAYLLFRFYFS